MPRRSTFPRFAEKWRHPSWVTPHDFVSTYHPPVEAPARCRVVWNPSVVVRLVRRFRARRVEGLGETYRLPGRRGSVGVTHPRGIGGPTTIARCEELVAVGTTEWIGVGYAGSLSPHLGPGDIALADRAVRDEGTSHHYAAPGAPAIATPRLRPWLGDVLREAGMPARVGPTGTTDAPYRETRPELLHYRGRGVLTVDREAASLFVFAKVRHVAAATAFVVSDRLTEGGWDPHFHPVGDRLFEVAATILDASGRPPPAHRVSRASSRSRPARSRRPRGRYGVAPGSARRAAPARGSARGPPGSPRKGGRGPSRDRS